jgi:hypothetical protein
MRTGFGLPCFANCGIPNRAMWKQSGLLTQVPCFVGETSLDRFGWFEEMASLHGGLHR